MELSIVLTMIYVGSLVVYKNKAAIVNEISEKLTIMLISGETVRVRDKDLLMIYEGPSSFDQLNCELKGDVKEAWELIENDTLSLKELAELIFGEWTAATAWSTYMLLKDGLYFTGTVEALQRQEADFVACEQEKRARKQIEAAERQAFLARLAEGSVKLPEDNRFLQDIEAFALGKTDKSRTLKGSGKIESPVEAHKILLETGFWDLRTNPHPSRLGISEGSALAPISPPPLDQNERLDLRHLKAFAVDNVWTSDPDDAVSIEGNAIWVHVADPAVSVIPGSLADEEAAGRGATLYLPEGAYRMLKPDSLPMFALGLEKNSLALSFKMTLNSDGSIANTQIFRSIVAVTRISYAQCDDSLDPDIQSLFDFASFNEKRRIEAGARIFHFPEVHINVSDDGITIEQIPSYRSARMIRECMLLAGEGSALWAINHNLAFPFVSQEVNELPKQPLTGFAGLYQIRRYMHPRVVSIKQDAHKGLGLRQYSQVTSPLRRYIDLLAHQQIRAVLCGQEPLDGETVQMRIGIADAGTAAIVKAERASRLHWTCVYLSDKKDSVWQAIVIERRSSGLAVFIPDLGVETVISTHARHALNDHISVILKSVKVAELGLSFAKS